jgi:hypothetical protein
MVNDDTVFEPPTWHMVGNDDAIVDVFERAGRDGVERYIRERLPGLPDEGVRAYVDAVERAAGSPDSR